MAAPVQKSSSISYNNKKRPSFAQNTNACKKLRLDYSHQQKFPQPPLSPPTLSSSSANTHKNIAIHFNSESDEEDGTGAAAQAAAIIRHRRGSKLSQKRRKSFAVPESDKQARQTCFDYLVSGIDEVWAQYCTCTSSAENDRYDELNPRNVEDLPSSPVSLCGEDEDEGYYTDASNVDQPHSSESSSDDSSKLLSLKKRLMNAKYFMADLVDANDPVSSAEFWSKWDIVKYSLVEVLEDNGDDDDVVESVTDELEQGRHYSSRY